MSSSDMQIMRAIQVVSEYLTAQFIEEECAQQPVMGCASCEAIELRALLGKLGREIMDDAHHRYPAPEADDPTTSTD